MRYPFSKTVFNCREATLLSVKRDEGALTLIERVKLGYHLLYCEPCRRFIRQWKMLKRVSRSARLFRGKPAFTLPVATKDKILQQLREMD